MGSVGHLPSAARIDSFRLGHNVAPRSDPAAALRGSSDTHNQCRLMRLKKDANAGI